MKRIFGKSTVGDQEYRPRGGLIRRVWTWLPRWSRLALGIVLVYALFVGVAAWLQRPSAIEAAATTCGTTLTVRDGGSSTSMTVADTPIGDSVLSWVTYDKFSCVADELEVPSYVMTHIGQTRALDGQQVASWDDFSGRWTYHPDDGLNITFRQD